MFTVLLIDIFLVVGWVLGGLGLLSCAVDVRTVEYNRIESINTNVLVYEFHLLHNLKNGSKTNDNMCIYICVVYVY